MIKIKLSPALACLAGILLLSLPAMAQERPNIVWVVSEDNSMHYLQLYNENGGTPMPNIEALARQGLVFNHAFSQAPVCSVARSTLISGSFAPRIGAQYHRATERVPMPEGQEMFPHYLRQAGYYTTNNAKEDYNMMKSDGVWDASGRRATYRDRKEGQPFFHVQNFGTTHEGQLHFTTEEMKTQKTSRDPDEFTPFPYHPNTPLFRYTYAKYYDLHQKVDQQIGEFIDQLEADGLMENTFIFYYGDHGGVLPRSKGYIYESGLHVPLVVYVPEKWKHLVPAEPGSSLDGFVQFMDFGPTVLNLAGVNVPDKMDGQPFLGKGVSKEELESRDVTFSYADRFDEKYDLVRAVRKGNLKYMRNFQPFNIDGLYNFYRFRMLAYQEWRELYDAGELNAVQRQFFEARPPEALYDLEKDPHETNNLANDPFYQTQLLELRGLLQQQLKSLPDLSFFPESEFLARATDNPVQFGRQNRRLIRELIDIADLSLLPFQRARPAIAKALSSEEPMKRYWALITCSSFGAAAEPFYDIALQLATEDPHRLVRVRAAEFLSLTGKSTPESVLVDAVATADSPTEANLILNTLALLKDSRDIDINIPDFKIRPEFLSMPGGLAGWRLAHLAEGTHPRLLVLTDIGGDPDDTQSLIRLLTHANEFEIEGLIASASGTPGELEEKVVRPDLIREIVRAYGQVERSLKTHSPSFPQAHTLQNLIKSGNPERGWEQVGAGHDTEGSAWIIKTVDRTDERPLNISIWGGQTDLAQALWRVKNDRSPEAYEAFVSKIRIYDIADQDGIFPQMQKSFPGLWYILNKAPENEDKRNAAFRGMYLGGDESLTSADWFVANVLEEHGPLGALYPQKTWTAPNPHGLMKEGDTPSWFYFFNNGLETPTHPDYGGWGGRFRQSDNGYYTDAPDVLGGKPSARISVSRWRPDYQREFAARMDWCVLDYAAANHPPQFLEAAATQMLSAEAGQTITITPPAVRDPDGDELKFAWNFYPEAGTFTGKLPEINAKEDRASFRLPPASTGKSLHLILTVSDDGVPALVRYQRYIIQVN
ncbi:nucleoside hydrolase-like domain-containing protein [Flavilitoribacter nigricans]|uniref:Sulfatase n=1 Tax=Flavilitoribacter nigricans (strain ATCC 23147 / DSM 23189 / NBRC 102662 / NCIMB 1420 / SS-2) TaxID=1122177 RepID=A0A2D0NCG0_FLAN2|nr:nucleoside hydrolase-like domain-containing protein [Flavilitoribacter nigricans]PHN06078.1 hypothetical protein CRP01_14000 [Flavilitoribacter nigricans DSM 23189 = NBRC 102662]